MDDAVLLPDRGGEGQTAGPWHKVPFRRRRWLEMSGPSGGRRSRTLKIVAIVVVVVAVIVVAAVLLGGGMSGGGGLY